MERIMVLVINSPPHNTRNIVGATLAVALSTLALQNFIFLLLQTRSIALSILVTFNRQLDQPIQQLSIGQTTSFP